MNLRIPATAVLVFLLAACSSGGDGAESSPEPSGSVSMSASATTTPSASASDPEQSPAAGVTVTGEAGAEPTIELSEDFGPVTELVVVDLVPGSGEAVEPGAVLTVHYVGVGEQSREVFDSSWPTGAPVTFPLAGVIDGWQEGMLGMQPGGRRLLVIPGSMAYGPDGYPPAIGPDETLVFVVDLIDQTSAS